MKLYPISFVVPLHTFFALENWTENWTDLFRGTLMYTSTLIRCQETFRKLMNLFRGSLMDTSTLIHDQKTDKPKFAEPLWTILH